jgi:hypothetical protein
MSDHLTLVDDDGITRREFTLDAVLAILAGCVITVTEGCGSSTPTTPTTPVNDIAGNVATNHSTPHVVTVTAAQITAGNQVTLTLTGNPSHTHTVTLTSADLNTLKTKGGVATETSSLDSNHTHVVTFTQT